MQYHTAVHMDFDIELKQARRRTTLAVKASQHRARPQSPERACDALARLLQEKLMHIYEVRPRKDHRGADLISDALPFGRLWHGEPNAIANAIGYAEHRSRSHHAVIRVYDDAGNVIETHERKGAISKSHSARCL
jgi:hypothetical protein